MRLVVADDEDMARFMVRSILAGPGIQSVHSIVAEARNGQELLDAIRATKPDAVIADIRMPGPDGLEALRAAKLEYPATEWIMLTGFSDFDYARDALRGGAFEYLLKPVLPEELAATLERVDERIQSRTAARWKALAEHLKLSLMDGNRKEIVPAEEALRLQLILFDSDDIAGSRDAADRFLAALEVARDSSRFGPASPARPSLACLALDAATLVLVSSEHAGASNADARILIAAARMAASDGQTAKSTGDSTTIFSCTVLAGGDAADALRSLIDAAALRCIHGLSRAYDINSLAPSPPEIMVFCHRLVAWANALWKGDFETAFRLADGMDQVAAAAESFMSEKERINARTFLAIRAGRIPEPRSGSISFWFRAATEGKRMACGCKRDIVDAAMALVHARYGHNIGLAFVAEQLRVSPNYLSSLFHKRVGLRFSEYITSYRIAQARRFLVLDSREPIALIARKVGFPNARYFSKRFILHVGIPPSEYREHAFARTFTATAESANSSDIIPEGESQ